MQSLVLPLAVECVYVLVLMISIFIERRNGKGSYSNVTRLSGRDKDRKREAGRERRGTQSALHHHYKVRKPLKKSEEVVGKQE